MCRGCELVWVCVFGRAVQKSMLSVRDVAEGIWPYTNIQHVASGFNINLNLNVLWIVWSPSLFLSLHVLQQNSSLLWFCLVERSFYWSTLMVISQSSKCVWCLFFCCRHACVSLVNIQLSVCVICSYHSTDEFWTMIGQKVLIDFL